MTDQWNTEFFGDPHEAVVYELTITYDSALDVTVLSGELLDNDGVPLAQLHRSWRGQRRNLALDAARLMARELELFFSPF